MLNASAAIVEGQADSTRLKAASSMLWRMQYISSLNGICLVAAVPGKFEDLDIKRETGVDLLHFSKKRFMY